MRALAAIGAAVAAIAATTLIVGPGDGTPHAVGTPAVHQQATTFATTFGGPPPANPAVGDVLFTGPGHWSGSPTGFAYAWKDCDSGGANCTTAAGSPTNTTRYQIVSGDVGFTIRVAVTASYSGHLDSTVMSQPTLVVGDGTFPLSVSSNGRYLQTSSATPFLMVGDSPQSGFGNLSCGTITGGGLCASSSNFALYLADRQAHGFNAVWEWLICDDYASFCNSNGSTYDSIFPFTGMTNPSNADVCGATAQPCTTPNTTYFARVHAMIATAQADGIAVLVTPLPTQNCNTGSWYTTLLNNGNGTTNTNTKDYQYGVWVGNYFKDLPNIIWASGNDFQCSNTTTAKNDELSVAEGIASVDPSSNALQTLEADYCSGLGNTCVGSSSLFDTGTQSGEGGTPQATGWSSLATLNGSYTYSPTYAENLVARGQAAKPVFLSEGNYEGEQNGGTDGCLETTAGLRNCRLQEWWPMTNGAAGQMYGCNCTTRLTNANFPNGMDTTGVTQLGYQTSLLDTLNWQDLAPNTTIVTAGGTGWNTCPSTGSITAVKCVTAATTADHTLALIYIPVSLSITVDMSQMSGTTTARWYDPTNGTFTTVTGSPFTAASHILPAPGNNSAGDSDWVLILQS